MTLGWKLTSRLRSMNNNQLKVLLVGNGAREHAIAWKLLQSPLLGELLVCPGNGGTSGIAENIDIGIDDINKILSLAIDRDVNFTVVGPETPLASGLVDLFNESGLQIFGPTSKAAQIESSKVFSKRLMTEIQVPTGSAMIFTEYSDAETYLENVDLPVVIKADGLAAGKGVVVAKSMSEAKAALKAMLIDLEYGIAGQKVLVEEYLSGPEISVFAFVNGTELSSLVAACDYKRLNDGNEGPNTGGMGAYSPPVSTLWNDDIEKDVREKIMEPTIRTLDERGIPYKGVLYAGLMLTENGPKVIEFNCRLGDPEAQVILPRLKNDLLEVMVKTSEGRLNELNFEWDDRGCVGVVLVSGGYPLNYTNGFKISGLASLNSHTMVFHAGTNRSEKNDVLTKGGRVLTVACLGEDIDSARIDTYSEVGKLDFKDAFYRKDIAVL